MVYKMIIGSHRYLIFRIFTEYSRYNLKKEKDIGATPDTLFPFMLFCQKNNYNILTLRATALPSFTKDTM